MSSKAYADSQFNTAFDKYEKAIEKYCAIRLGEAVHATDDCVQETFLLYYRKLLFGEQFENIRAFLYKTANNMVLKARENYFKDAKHTEELSAAENIAVDTYSMISDDVDYDKIKELLISKLSDNEQQLYHMKYVEGKSLREIGEILNIPPAAVANRTSRLRTKVKKLVEPILIEFEKGGS